VELVLIICLMSRGDTCEERHLSVALEPVAETVCMTKAIPYLAQWAGEHPQWKIKRWRCTVAGTEGRSI
jgi:hypothetical protein